MVLVDVQWNLTGAGRPPGRDLYAAAHLPGAHHVDLDAELAAPARAVAGGTRCPPRRRSRRRCGDAARRPTPAIVVYDQGPSYAAARAWWVLRYFGAQRRPGPRRRPVRVGRGRRLPTTAEVPAPGDGHLRGPRLGSCPLLDADGAAALARDGILLDARAPERFRGESEPIDPVAGHIPGAVNAPTIDNARADGRFLDRARPASCDSRAWGSSRQIDPSAPTAGPG